MEILEAFDLTGTLRGAAELAGCDHKTVAHWVRARDAGRRRAAGAGAAAAAGGCVRGEDRGVGRSLARARSARTSRISGWSRWAIWVRSARRAGRSRRPSGAGAPSTAAGRGRGSTEPGLWMQWDYGDGPEGRRPVDGVVLRVAGVVAVPGRAPALGSDDAVGGDGAGSGAAGVRRRADLRADRQRADGLGRSRLRDRGPQPADRRRSAATTG